MKVKSFLCAAALAASGALSPAQAATGAQDLQVMARAIGFVDGLSGNVPVAIVDGPGADAIIAAMSGNLSGGSITLQPRKVAVGDLASSGVKAIIVPEGMAGAHAQIGAAAQSLGAVTLSTDMSCVTSGNCAVGVATSPRVDIIVSRAATSAAGIDFSQAFRVMIREQ